MGGQEIEKGCDRRTVTNSMPKLSVSAYNNKSLSINTQLSTILDYFSRGQGHATGVRCTNKMLQVTV